MKIQELKCSACGALLKIDKNNPQIAECEYCHNRFGIEWDQPGTTNEQPRLTSIPQRIDYTPIPQAPPKSTGSRRETVISIAAIAVFVIGLGIWWYSDYHSNSKTSKPDSALTPSSAPVIDFNANSSDKSNGSNEANALSEFSAQFAEAVFGKPIDEISEGDLAKIQWLEMKFSFDDKKIGYSFDNPMENPSASLTWLSFSRDDNTDALLNDLWHFTGLKALNIPRTLSDVQVKGLALQSISGKFDSLEQVANLLEKPEDIRQVAVSGNKVSLSGIERFPNLEALDIDSDAIEEDRLLVNAASLQSFSVDLSNGSMDFSVFSKMSGLKRLSIRSKNLKDLDFLPKLEQLTSLSLEDGNFLTLAPLATMTNLKELSITDCRDLKDMSAISSLTELTSLTMELPYNCPQPELGALTKLEYFCASGIDDTAFLRNMKQLASLTLKNFTISNPSDFTGLKNLKSLTCTSGSTGQDFSFITALSSLETLDLHGAVTYNDISGIFNMPGLKECNLSGMQCEINFDRVQKNTSLQTLSMNNMTLYKNAKVVGGGGMYSVYWDDVSLCDHLDFFEKLTGLKNLSVKSNELTEIGFASSLAALQSIDLSDNYVTSLDPLSGLKALETVTCTDNPISNYEVLGDAVTLVR